jgi:anti-sigma B factor antagonist
MAAEDYTVEWVGQQAVIATPAEIDAVNAGQISQALLSAATLGAPVLIIDMSGTTFCDSAGVGAIIAAHRQATMTGTQLRLVATAVVRILTLTGIGQLAPIYPTLQAALAATPAAEASTRDPFDGPEETTASGDPRTEPPPGTD